MKKGKDKGYCVGLLRMEKKNIPKENVRDTLSPNVLLFSNSLFDENMNILIDFEQMKLSIDRYSEMKNHFEKAIRFEYFRKENLNKIPLAFQIFPAFDVM